MPEGTVKWFNSDKGYGFIAPDDGSADVFVHHSTIKIDGFRTLQENQRVEYTAGRGPQGPAGGGSPPAVARNATSSETPEGRPRHGTAPQPCLNPDNAGDHAPTGPVTVTRLP